MKQVYIKMNLVEKEKLSHGPKFVFKEFQQPVKRSKYAINWSEKINRNYREIFIKRTPPPPPKRRIKRYRY